MKATVTATFECDDDELISKLKGEIMSVKDDLKADIAEVRASQEATKQAVLDAVATETQQVSATVASLEAKLGDMLDPADLAELRAELQALKSHPEDLVAAIDAIHNPTATEPTTPPTEPPVEPIPTEPPPAPELPGDVTPPVEPAP